MNNLNKVVTFITISLVFLGIFSVEYLRPKFPQSLFLGSFPNFIGAFILYSVITSLFFEKRINVKNQNNIYFYLKILGFFIFLFFALEEFFPFFTASKTLDFYDILASALGVYLAYLIVRQILKLKND